MSISERTPAQSGAPQNTVAYGTETFEACDFVRTGLVLTSIALVMALGATYWAVWACLRAAGPLASRRDRDRREQQRLRTSQL